MTSSTDLLITVVVPVYNAADYLPACMDGLRKQTFVDYEVWLIDDGSTDTSAEICRVVVAQDPRFHLYQQKNQGVSMARNAGLERAQGSWICFVDADDFVSPDYLSALYAGIGENTELVIQGFQTQHADGQIVENRNYTDCLYTHDTIRDAFDSLYLNRSGYPFGKLFKASLISQYHLRFNSEIHYGEDKIFFLQYVTHIDRMQVVSGMNYHYILRGSGSLSVRINHYESEYCYYQNYVALAEQLNERFVFFDETYNEICNAISEVLIRRALGSMYQQKTKKPYRERLRLLKAITKEQLSFCTRYYTDCNWFHRLTVYLLSRQQYLLCDCLLSTIVGGRALKQQLIRNDY